MKIKPLWQRFMGMPALWWAAVRNGHGVILATELCWSGLTDPVGTLHTFRAFQKFQEKGEG